MELIFRSDEASKGGFQAVIEVEGILSSIERVPPKFTGGEYGEPKDQAKIILDDATINEMEPGEPEPELNEGQYTFWLNYATKGKEKAHQNTFYVKGFCKSAEGLAKAREIPNGCVSDLLNSRVVLRKASKVEGGFIETTEEGVLLFQRPVSKDSEEKEQFYSDGFIFVNSEGGSDVDIIEHVKSLVIGKTKGAALRPLMMDNKAKRNPEFKVALADDTLAEVLGLTVVDGKFAEA